ncbi:glycosyltransferase family 4 protein [Brachybacterium endophyticum]|uniref:glycosyltransferase family 4 protein n=1 Tax=Brachybacterium endophyticum TaxID=2182385 RepID=UPI00196B3121|nr:glycosyltransferase family 4 protein [Brachybacterium endophyticum]
MLIPKGLAALAGQSGIGEAIRHQRRAVESLGHEVVTSPFADFDVVHLNTPFPDTPLLAAWAHLRRRPVMMWAHSTEEDFRDSFTGANRIAPWFRRWIAWIYRRGDAVITPTPYAQGLISRPRYGIRRPIHVLSNGVDTTFFRRREGDAAALRERLGLPADARVVMSVGLQMVRKGILEWIEVARALPEVTFVWYGRTDPRLITEEVSSAVASAPSNCLFPGFVAPEQLREAYGGADAFCFLTKEETEGIVLLEALSCEAPVLLSDIPIYSDWLPDGEVVHKVAVPPAKAVGSKTPGAAHVRGQAAERIAGRLRSLLDGELTDLSAAGRRAAEAVDMHEVAASLQGIYEAERVTEGTKSTGISARRRASTAPSLRSPHGQDAGRAAER